MKEMQEQTLLPMTGIILAGGKSSRMGRNKAFLPLEGVPLIERSLAVMRAVFQEVLVSSNQPELYQKYGVKVVKDNYLEKGPLGGLEACLREASYDYAFFAACDMPFLHGELIRYMATMLGQEEILVPELEGRLHPLHAFYPKSCLPLLEKNLQTQQLKLAAVIQQYPQVHYLREKDLGNFPDLKRYLSNINTPEEWQALVKITPEE